MWRVCTTADGAAAPRKTSGLSIEDIVEPQNAIRDALLNREFKDAVEKQFAHVLSEIALMRTKQEETMLAFMTKHSDEAKGATQRMRLLLERSEEASRILSDLKEELVAKPVSISPRSPHIEHVVSVVTSPDGASSRRGIAISEVPGHTASDSIAYPLTSDELLDMPSSGFQKKTKSVKNKSSRSKKKKRAKQPMSPDINGTSFIAHLSGESSGQVNKPWEPIIGDSSRNLVKERVAQRVTALHVPEAWKPVLLERDTRLGVLVRTRAFFLFVNLLILSNVVFIALQAEHSVRRATLLLPTEKAYAAGDIVFSALFAMDLFARSFGERAFFFLGPDCYWNVMDVVFCMFDFINVLVTVSMQDGGSGQIDGIRGGVRVLRLVRAGRVLRVLHSMKFIKMVRLLVDVMQASLGFSMCMIAFMAAMFVFFSVIFMQATADALMSGRVDGELHDHFGSISESSLTLFWCMIGHGTPSVYDALATASPVYGFSLIVFVFFMTFAFANSVTASMVEYAFRASRKYDLEGSPSDNREIEGMLKEAANAHDGLVSWMEIKHHLSRADVQDKFSSLGIDGSEARGLFELMAPSENAHVPIEDVAQVYSRFTRMVRSADFVQVLVSSKRILENIASLQELVQGSIMRDQDVVTRLDSDFSTDV